MIDLSKDFETPSTVRFRSGIYEGRTVQEIWEENPKYLQWYYWESNGAQSIKEQIRNAFESAGEDL